MRYSKLLSVISASDLPDAANIGLAYCDLDVPGIIGIQIPFAPGSVELDEFNSYLTECLKEYDTDIVIITEPKPKWFHHKDKVQMEALARRVNRDRNDGIRYNRLFIALYRSNNPVPESVKLEHNYFITIENKNLRKTVTTLQINEK